jgi:YVTN family beta-propeller protein
MVLAVHFTVSAQNVNYVFDKKIPLQGDAGYDYLSIDTLNNRLYVSHGTKVDVVDLQSETAVGSIENLQGVHGIAIAYESGKGFISDGKANAVVAFDLKTLKTIKTITITGKDPDAIMYDPFSHSVYAFNGDSHDASVIDVNSLQQTGSIDVGGAPEFAVPDGAGRIYNNLEDKNEIVVIDTKSKKVVNRYPLSPCGGPTGLYFDFPDGRLYTACRQNKGMSVIDIRSGKVISTVPIGAGVDAVVYDPSSQLIFCSNGDGTTTIIKKQSRDNYSVSQTLTTEPRAKTIALDRRTHKLYLSTAEFENGTRNRLPGTFHLLVYKQQ